MIKRSKSNEHLLHITKKKIEPKLRSVISKYNRDKLKKLKSSKHFLYILKEASSKLRNSILKNSGDHLIKALCECCLNTLNGNHKISPVLKRKLCRYSGVLRKLSSKKVALKRKRGLLIQSGGFLPALLTSILSGVVGSLLQ